MKHTRLNLSIGKLAALTAASVASFSLAISCGGGGGDEPVVPPASNGSNGTIGSTGTTPVTGMLTYHNDNYRTGRNLNETALNRTNVNKNTFGKISALPVDGQVYGQPLVANQVMVGNTPKNLLFVVTENDSVYAFDISDRQAVTSQSVVWQRSFISECTSSGANCGPVDIVTDIQTQVPNISPYIGITSTPVIDPVSQTIYLTAMTSENGKYFWRLHALSLATGEERANSPIEISATYPGVGAGSVGGIITFDPIHQLQRAGLVLNKGIVTIPFTSFDDGEPTHGWIFSYDAATLQLAGTWMTTPNTGIGTIWQSGGAPGVDDDDSLIFATGNGDPDAYPGQHEFGDSILRIKMGAANFQSPTLAYSTQPADFFTPYNYVALDQGDVELGSGGVLLIPTSDNTLIGSPKKLAITGGKQGTIYVLDRENLGGLNLSQDLIVQELVSSATQTYLPGGQNGGPGIYSTPAYYNGKVFIAGAGDFLRSIPLVNGLLDWTQMHKTAQGIAQRGSTPSISASGPSTSDAIVWYLDSSNYTYTWIPGHNPASRTNGPAILSAYSTDDLSTPLFVSTPRNLRIPPASLQALQTRDNCAALDPNAAGCAVKFAVPTVQNGMVFVGTDTEISVYGLK